MLDLTWEVSDKTCFYSLARPSTSALVKKYSGLTSGEKARETSYNASDLIVSFVLSLIFFS